LGKPAKGFPALVFQPKKIESLLMRRYLFALVPVLLTALLLLSGCGGDVKKDARIQEFTVEDIPNDEGAGIQLKWTPLDKSQRVIQYNIYRGFSPDSLFYLSKIEVDPDVGVVGGSLNYTDQGFGLLIEFETAPGKLKTEKQQVADGVTLFKTIPRDPKFLAEVLPHFMVLGDIPVQKYYNQAKRVEQESPEGNQVFAGYRLSAFNAVFARLLDEKPYYYCVVPVTETGKFLPATEVKHAQATNNRPDATAIFYSSYLEDKNEFRFEWTPPQGGNDIVAWQPWLMPRNLLPLFEQNQKANATAPDSIFHAVWQVGSIPIAQIPTPYRGQVLYAKAVSEQFVAPIPPVTSLANYIPVLSYMDVKGYWNAALGRELVIAQSSDLPKLPHYEVLDKTNDKGDNLIISFGRPFAFVSQAAWKNKANTKLRLNYDVSENGHQSISKLRFRFFENDGTLLKEVIETHPDKTIFAHFPKGRDPHKDFRVEISALLVGEKKFSDIAVSQIVSWEESSSRFVGADLSNHDQVLNNIYYDIFSRDRLSDFSPGMRIGALSRSYDHTISYPSSENPLFTMVDPKTNLVLVDPSFLVAIDEETGAGFEPSLFKKDTVAEVEELEAQINELKKAPKNESPKAELERMQQLDELVAQQTFVLEHPAYLAGKDAKNDRVWRKIMRRELDMNSRSYAYKLLVTDGQGLWSDEEDLPDHDPSKKPEFMHPENEWFDTTKWATLIASIIMGIMVVVALYRARRFDLYIRPIAGLEELDNAVGRATEMGRPVMFVPGWGTLGDPCTISAMMILNQIAKKTAEYDIRIISPHVDYFVLPLAQEMVLTAYNEAGRTDAYNAEDIYFVSDSQFAFSAAVNGITVREKVATIFYMGYFNAEALLMTETGNQAGAIQIAASDAITQIPFFITTCDYTLIGEEFYAASAYLSRNIELVSMLKAQDYFKLLIVVSVIFGTIISTLGINFLLNFLPVE